MASTSSQSSPRKINYDVFLSFRGEKIEDLLRIIKESRFAIVVFFKDYACLEEIATIMECQQRYDEKILQCGAYKLNVRHQTGSFAESFAKHEEDYKNVTGKVKRWRDALTEACRCSLSGYHLKDGYDGRHSSPFVEACIALMKLIFVYIKFDDEDIGRPIANYFGVEGDTANVTLLTKLHFLSFVA
nr:TMV resistance protein N-like [Ipomoea batatas]